MGEWVSRSTRNEGVQCQNRGGVEHKVKSVHLDKSLPSPKTHL
jgi:hypothetical protein